MIASSMAVESTGIREWITYLKEVTRTDDILRSFALNFPKMALI